MKKEGKEKPKDSTKKETVKEEQQEELGQKSKESARWVFVLLAFGIVILAYSVQGFIDIDSLSQKYVRFQDKEGVTILGSVPVITWASPERRFAQEIALARKPAVLRNTIVEKYKARKTWTPEYITDKVDNLKSVYEHTEKVFTFYDPFKPFGSFEGVVEDILSSHQTVTIPTYRFFEIAELAEKNKSYPVYYYYSGPLSDFGPKLEKEVQPLDYLRVKEGNDVFYSVWMGYNGTIAHTHYDIFNNFHFLIYGKKRFVLFPPSEWERMYPHPRHHPNYRQSQVDFAKPDLENFPLFRGIVAYEVILEPGDLLYIPPFWGHQVTSLKTSIALNCFSDSREMMDFYGFEKVPIGFLNQTNDAELLNAHLITLFQQLTVATKVLEEGQEPRDFFKRVFDSRYSHLYPILSQYSKRTNCPVKTVSQTIKDEIKDVVGVLVKMMKKTDISIRKILLGNYIEDVLKGALTEKEVATFLKYCLVEKK